MGVLGLVLYSKCIQAELKLSHLLTEGYLTRFVNFNFLITKKSEGD